MSARLIDDDGTVAPAAVSGRIAVAGAPPRIVEQKIIQTCFERGIPHQPSVQVTLKRMRQQQITVIGGVERPGIYTMPRNSCDLVSVLATAGGLSRKAGEKIIIQGQASTESLSPVMLTGGTGTNAPSQPTAMRRELDVRALALGQTLPPVLSDGDVVMVEVRDPPTVLVNGMVGHPGPYEFPVGREFRVLDAIAAASGITNKIVDTVLVCRPDPSGSSKRVVIQVSMREAARDQAENLMLMPGDIVSVEPNKKMLLKDGVKYVGIGAAGAHDDCRSKPPQAGS